MLTHAYKLTDRPDAGLVSWLSCRAAELAGKDYGTADALAYYAPGDTLGRWIDRIGSHDVVLACALKKAAGIGG